MGRAVRPSLFVFCAGLVLLAASLDPATYFCWLGLVLLLLPPLLLTSPACRLPLNALSASLLLFCALLLANALLYSPHYSAYSTFLPLTLLASFAASALLRDKELESLFRASTVLLSLLVLFAFLAGMAFIALYAGLPRTREEGMRWKRLFAGLLWVFVAYYALKALVVAFSASLGRGSIGDMLIEDIAARGVYFRPELVGVALGLIAERPFAGAGANTWWPLYEMVKPAALDIGFSFPFVHNDYLQVWLEYGFCGIALLSAIMAAAAIAILKARSRWREDPVPLAAGAALSSIFVHALGDFPLYVLFPLMVLGAWLGVLAARAGDAAWAAQFGEQLRARLAPVRTPLISGAIFFALVAWLAQPMIAYAAARHAVAELFAGRVDAGLYWQSVARRLEPKSGMRHWEEGVIWREQALASGDKEFAAKADAAFAEGIRVDPYDANNFAERLRLHRMHASLLENPAPAAELLRWGEQLLSLRPYALAIQAEHARTLAHVGRPEEARQRARAMLAKHPNSTIARRLADEI
jgi:hypothetical protein